MNVNDLSPALLDRTVLQKERVIITSLEGKPVAALIPIEDLYSLQEMDDESEEFLAACEEADKEPVVSWDDLKRELKL